MTFSKTTLNQNNIIAENGNLQSNTQKNDIEKNVNQQNDTYHKTHEYSNIQKNAILQNDTLSININQTNTQIKKYTNWGDKTT